MRCVTSVSPRLVDQVLVAVSMAHGRVGSAFRLELESLAFGLEVSPDGEPTLLDEIPEGALPVPVRRRPSLYFLEEFYALAAGLAARRPMRILGDEESGFQVDGDALAPVLAQLEATHTACQPGFNGQVLARLSARIREELLARLGQASPELFGTILRQVTELVADKRAERAADGLLAGWFALYGEGFAALEGWLAERRADESERGVRLARSLGYGCAGAHFDPMALARGFLDSLGEPALLERLARRSLKRSQQAVRKALGADTQDAFEDHLYRASLDHLATRQLSLALGRKSAARRAEKRWLEGGLALIHCLQNRSGERLAQHRARLAQLGAKKQERLLDELIEERLLYPRSMRAALV